VRVRRVRLNRIVGGRFMVEVMARESPPIKKCSLWFNMATTISGDMWVRAVWFLVGEKKMVIKVVPKRMKMDLGAMMVNASGGFLQSVVIVYAAFEVLRT
jgi:hypothetical protein